MGCFIKKKIEEQIKLIEYTVEKRISRNSLFKILILEINEKVVSFFLKF